MALPPIPASTYWSDIPPKDPATPQVSMLQPTPGMTKVTPYSQLRGSDGVNLAAPQIAVDAAEIFPIYDGVTNKLPNTPANIANPDAQTFLSWHTGHQIEHLKTVAASTSLVDGALITYRTAQLMPQGSTVADTSRDLGVMLSEDGERSIEINALDPTEIARLTLNEQRALTRTSTYQEVLAPRLGLTPVPPQGVEDARSAFTSEIDRITDAMLPDAVKAQLADFRAGTVAGTEVWQLYFSEQLEMLKTSLNGMAVFHADTINQKIADIVERYDRVEKFATMTAEVPNPVLDGFEDAKNAVDGGASVRAAFDLFVRYESQIHAVKAKAEDLARTGIFEGQKLDTPGMTFIFQTFANYIKEHEANALTEELNQQTKLLQDYTQMQRVVNETLARFDPLSLSNPDTALERLSVQKVTYIGDLAATDKGVVAMFNTKSVFSNDNSLHPIEQMKALTRPTVDFADPATGFAVLHTKSIYDSFALDISNATKTINQDSQIKMNEASQLNKERNRHYDLATNTLNKMTEMLRSIIM